MHFFPFAKMVPPLKAKVENFWQPPNQLICLKGTICSAFQTCNDQFHFESVCKNTTCAKIQKTAKAFLNLEVQLSCETHYHNYSLQLNPTLCLDPRRVG